jgi:hypothetical protein
VLDVGKIRVGSKKPECLFPGLNPDVRFKPQVLSAFGDPGVKPEKEFKSKLGEDWGKKMTR